MFFFFFSSRRRHTRSYGDWSSDVCSSDLCSGPREALSHSLIKPLLALQETVKVPKEHAGFGSLDDAVIVCAGDRDDLGAGDIADRPRRDDRALALHQAGDRGDGAERAGVGELDRPAG